ncbi:hypothetical protein EKO27_g5767 [Xylaria grammica]|uniref:Chromo domain-containing protein n=1 Tax=Xylaria grammica TaxID=363999 RepID=A0A439D4M1_9PEZI|nr:hypothetical protein EKO27_g5767 [Xylaria grammica]
MFREKNIAFLAKKSFLGYPSVELLGFRVDGLGISTPEEKLAAFRNLAFPSQLKALEKYIGATGFLRPLLPYYAKIMEPLQRRKTALLNEGRQKGLIESKNPGKRMAYCKSTWYEPTEEEKAAFEAIQDLICRNTLIYHHDPDKQLYMQVDASLERGFGVMLFHIKDGYKWEPDVMVPGAQVLPTMFLSRCVSQPELRYGPSEMEVACVVWACKRLRTTVEACRDPVIVLTDHSSTKGIVDQTNMNTTSTDRANKRLINASIYLSQYGLQVYHILGRRNFVPDALSCLQADSDELDENGKIKRSDEVAVLDDIWFNEVITEAILDDSVRDEIAADYLKDPKYSRILQTLRDDNEDVENFFRPGYPFAVVKKLLYNVDRKGTYRLCIPRDQIGKFLASAHDDKHYFGRERMMQNLEGYSIYAKTRKGVPTGLISDRDSKFTSDFWSGMWKTFGSRLLMTTAYHPQGDGLSERKNQTVEIAMRYYTFEHPDRPWVDVLPALQWNLNSAYSAPIKSSPHEQLFGFRLPGPNNILTQVDTTSYEDIRFLREHLRKDAELAMDFAASRAKYFYDRKHKLMEFNVRDEVYLKLHDGYHLPGRPSKKYSQQRAGPWKVLERVGRLSYRLDLPETFEIYPVVSIAHLSPGRKGEDPFHRSIPVPGPVLDDQPDSEEEGESFEIETILKHRLDRQRTGFQYLVKWKGYGHEDNWWRSEWQLRNSKDLVEEYWVRKGGREALPLIDNAKGPVKRGRGRPRKDQIKKD